MDLFKSKRFWSAAIGVFFMGIVHFVPQLQQDQTVLTEAILVVIGLLVGGYTVEQSVQAARKQ